MGVDGKGKDEHTKKRKWKEGPRLPSKLQRRVDEFSPEPTGEGDFEEGHDVYEYDSEGNVPEEESKKNKRFDTVETLDDDLPEDFEDEEVQSDSEEDDDDGESVEFGGRKGDDKHARMLQGITGLPGEIFDFKEGRTERSSIEEAYPESEYNPTLDVLSGDVGGRVSINDLLNPLRGNSGYSRLRKRVEQMVRVLPDRPPLPKVDRERLERRAAYEQTKKDVTRWEPLVKRNRELPTLYFGRGTDIGFSTVGAIASGFEPATDFERRIDSLVADRALADANQNDGARLFELNKVTAEDVAERQNRLAKMRSLLFRHELKAKRIKQIKSKTFHRLLKKNDWSKTAAVPSDPEAAKEEAMKQEFRRAEERMRQKHKNSSRWVKRILKRGLAAQDEGTRAAISEQLHEHNRLVRKMNSIKDGSGSDDDDDGSDDGGNVEEKIRRIAGEEEEDGGSISGRGVLALPFMVRAMKRRREAAEEDIRRALEEYDGVPDAETRDGNDDDKRVSGRLVFGRGIAEDVTVTPLDPFVGEPPELDGGLAGSTALIDVGRPVDGVTARIPSQEECMRRAFACDDVEGEFEREKEEAARGENPEPDECPVMPGWGDWVDVQRARGPPAWMVKRHEEAKRARDAALARRKDARLRHVIISEKLDKKVEKLRTRTLPFPFTSKDVFEQSIRMPVGPDFNPAMVVGSLNRPEVVKTAGVIIGPIDYRDAELPVVENKAGGKRTKRRKKKST